MQIASNQGMPSPTGVDQRTAEECCPWKTPGPAGLNFPSRHKRKYAVPDWPRIVSTVSRNVLFLRTSSGENRNQKYRTDVPNRSAVASRQALADRRNPTHPEGVADNGRGTAGLL